MLEIKEDKITATARQNTFCLGCGHYKEIGLVVCWQCFKYRKDIVPLKYFSGSFREWLQMVYDLLQLEKEANKTSEEES